MRRLRVVFVFLVTLAACGSGDASSDGGAEGGPAAPPGSPGSVGAEPGDPPLRLAVIPRRISAGADYSCAVTDGGLVKCWGRNDFGQLGIGSTQNRGDQANEMGARLPAVDLGGKALAVTAGWYHACALLEGGTVKCWGKNDQGQLGQGDTENRGVRADQLGAALAAVDLGHDRPVVALSAGGYHTCALFDDGALKCWGGAELGQLGLGDTNPRGDGAGEMGRALPFVDVGGAVVFVSAGNLHTCAVLRGGAVKCWGVGQDGQLGLGAAENRGSGPGEMGRRLPAVDLGAGAVAVEVAAGGFHSCARLQSGAVKCWGHSDQGQLGLGNKDKRGDQPGSMGDALPAVNLGDGRKATALSTLYDHTCALFEDATVKCWGWNKDGQLGLGDRRNRGDAPSTMGDALPVVNLGSQAKGAELGVGWDHTCARLQSGAFKCWGLNWAGHLGLGHKETRGDGPGEMGDALPAVPL